MKIEGGMLLQYLQLEKDFLVCLLFLTVLLNEF